MKWENLKFNKCPSCGKELQFRVANRNTHIRSRQYKNNVIQDMYFCFRCNFQIKAGRAKQIIQTFFPKESIPKKGDKKRGLLDFD